MRSAILALAPLFFASYVSAHGYLAAITINGQRNRSPLPHGQRDGNSDTSAIRQVSTAEPIYGVNNPSNNCGVNARNAARVLDANPGDTLTFDWKGGDGRSNWPHNTGPMITYLANCGNTPCNEFDSRNARWFKIHQVGRKENSGEWFQQDLMRGGVDEVKLPANIAPGNYLVRHEIIALHLATSPATPGSGAEFYPGCAQLRIGGNGTGRPTENELVSHPGAYQADHRGIFVPDVFSSRSYTFPGPPVAAFVNQPASSGGNNNNNGGNNGGNSSAPSPGSSTRVAGGSSQTASPAPQPTQNTNNTSQSSTRPKQVCKAKKSKRSALDSQLHPRHFSRVMRRMFASTEFEKKAVLAARH